MSYTPTPLRPKVSTTFSGLVDDGNRNAMTGVLGNTTVSQDASASPVTSPASNMSGSGVALLVPTNAVQLTVNCTVTIQVGEDSSYAQGIIIPASTLATFDCARMTNIYLKPSSGTNTTSFQFKVV